MPDEAPTASANRELTAEIVAAYLRRNQTAFDQLATLISTVHQAVAGLGKPPAEAVVERTPAVSIRRSITANSVICLDCGWKGQMLRRHVATAHGSARRAVSRTLALAARPRHGCASLLGAAIRIGEAAWVGSDPRGFRRNDGGARNGSGTATESEATGTISFSSYTSVSPSLTSDQRNEFALSCDIAL
jgi:hypothetical protein